jgi:hypothetical protein
MTQKCESSAILGEYRVSMRLGISRHSMSNLGLAVEEVTSTIYQKSTSLDEQDFGCPAIGFGRARDIVEWER